MKTPEEIKKGLEQCSNTGVSCSGCPYDNDCHDPCSYVSVETDALAYIQWLESRIEQLENVIRLLVKEKDAAIHDCAMFPCSTCSDRENKDLCYTCLVHPSSERSNYNWRGVCEENTHDQPGL